MTPAKDFLMHPIESFSLLEFESVLFKGFVDMLE